MTRRAWASIATACALTLACTGSPRPADVVVYASGTDLESANPLVTIHPASKQVQRHVLLVTLVRYDSALAIQPYYARSWREDRGRRELTFHLEPTLRWHDGRRTTSADVAFTILAARDPATGFPRASDLADVDTVLTPDDTTVVVRFRSALRGVPQVFVELPIVPRHLLADVPRAEMRRAAFNLDPVGNGPFRFVNRTPGQQWTFERNEDFPPGMGGPPQIRQLVVAVVDEATTKFAGLAAGDLDFAGIAPTMARLAERDPMIEVVDYPVLFSTALVFNVQRSPFDDVRVRQAVNLAIDRDRVIAVALAGFATPAGGPVPPDNPLALEIAPRLDPATADSLLDAAGWRRGADGWRARGGNRLAVELLTVGSSDNELEQLIQADLAQRGIRLSIRQMEMAAFLARARAAEKDFDVLITGIPGDLSLAYVRAMYESSQRGGTLDYSGFHSARLDRLFALAANAAPESAARHWHDVQRELGREVPAAWIYHSRGLQGVSARMRHVRMDLRGEMATVARWTTDVTTAPARRTAVR